MSAAFHGGDQQGKTVFYLMLLSVPARLGRFIILLSAPATGKWPYG